MQSSRYTALPMDEREFDPETAVCCTASDVVPDGVAELPCLIAVAVKGLEFGEEVEALVAVVCGEVGVPAVDDSSEPVVVIVVVSTAKPCCWRPDTSR